MKTFLSRYGTWAVVTGASSGIGREISLQLAAEGFSLLLVARREEELNRLREEITSGGKIKAIVLPVDLGRRDACAAVFEAARHLDTGLLVNCAGFGLGGLFLENNVEEEASMIDVNCRALMELTHSFGDRFAAQGRGGIILMSSIVAFQGVPRSANYAATKAYVQTLGEALAVEFHPRGVDVLISKPGPTASGFAARAGMNLGKTETSATVARETWQALGRKSSVAPGLLSKVLLAALMTAPRSLRVQIMKAIMRSMT